MHQQTIQEIVKELESVLVGRFVGKIFQLSPLSLAIDFGIREGGFLFMSADPALPGIYLIKRRGRDLEQQSIPPLLFAQAMRSNLGGGKLLSIARDKSERVVRLVFSVANELGEVNNRALVAQITGRSANLFLLDHEAHITHALRAPKGEGQQVGKQYEPPASRRQPTREEGLEGSSPALRARLESPLDKGAFPSLSAAADDHYKQLELAQSFAARVKTIRNRLQKEIAQRTTLKNNLARDLATHGNAEQHKRLGDLLLANIATARRTGNKVALKDFFNEGAPEIEIEVDENTSLQREAGRYFARYTKAKRAAEEIAGRLAQLERETTQLQDRKTELEEAIAAGDEAALSAFEDSKAPVSKTPRKAKQDEKIPGVRRYRSSDGYEILVGRAAHTNDRLTFRVARPHDLWLHAADYPGSHVVIRNQSRSDIPHRTIIEAAQLAAMFSQAGNDSKVTIHYTPRKFLSKPKGAAPGLVRMSSFKTITVAPSESIARL